MKPANPEYHGAEGFWLQGRGLVNFRAVTLGWLVAAGSAEAQAEEG